MVQTLPIGTDFVIQSADRNAVAFVEVKNPIDFSPEVAAAYRQTLIGILRPNWWPRFFMLVSQDVGYLWDEETLPHEGDAPLPTIQFPMFPVIQFYLPSLADGRRLSGSSVELAVSQWLWELVRGVEDRPKEPEAALARTDFLQLIRGGRVGRGIEV
jgi:hypothetical protein